MKRNATVGLIGIKQNSASSVSISVLKCETDFVSSSENFQHLANTILNSVTENNELILKKEVDGSSIEERINKIITTTQEKVTTEENHLISLSDDKIIGSYVHNSSMEFPNLGSKASYVVLSIDSNVSKDISEKLQKLANNLAMQVVACMPQYTRVQDIPQEVLDSELETIKEHSSNENAVKSKLQNFEKEIALEAQDYVIVDHDSNEPKMTVQKLLNKTKEEFKLQKLELVSHKLYK